MAIDKIKNIEILKNSLIIDLNQLMIFLLGEKEDFDGNLSVDYVQNTHPISAARRMMEKIDISKIDKNHPLISNNIKIFNFKNKNNFGG